MKYAEWKILLWKILLVDSDMGEGIYLSEKINAV